MSACAGSEDVQRLQMTLVAGWTESTCTPTTLCPADLVNPSQSHQKKEFKKYLNTCSGCHHSPLLLKGKGHHLPGRCTHKPKSKEWHAKIQSYHSLVSL